ncbi:hypothetical protein [Nostoc sp.]|uniref:hypothetical protein n=1 Tax=Nostoc sp. TaxID=1180 RepID=UPI002FF8D94D
MHTSKGLPKASPNRNVTVTPDPFYAVDTSIGIFDFYRGTIELSGLLNDFRTLLYRLNVAYQDRNTFIEGSGDRNFYIAPVISLMLVERTRLTLEGDYQDLNSNIS